MSTNVITLKVTLFNLGLTEVHLDEFLCLVRLFAVSCIKRKRISQIHQVLLTF
jgi:hypothetical protein